MKLTSSQIVLILNTLNKKDPILFNKLMNMFVLFPIGSGKNIKNTKINLLNLINGQSKSLDFTIKLDAEYLCDVHGTFDVEICPKCNNNNSLIVKEFK